MANNLYASKLLSEIHDLFIGRYGLGSKEVIENVFLAGGCLLPLTEGERPNDYDVFFKDPKVLAKVVKCLIPQNVISFEYEKDEQVSGLYRGMLKSGNRQKTLVEQLKACNNSYKTVRKTKLGGDHYNVGVRYLSENAISLNNKVQIILRFIGPPEKVFQTFDYEHCKLSCSADPLGATYGKVNFFGDSQLAIANKQLVYNGGSRFVVSAVNRLEKFVKRGWSINPLTPFRLAESLSRLDLTNRNTVREELLGMYGIDPSKVEWILDLVSDSKTTVNKDSLFQILKEL